MINGKWCYDFKTNRDVFIAENGEIFKAVKTICIGDDKPLFIGSKGTIAELSEFNEEKEV